MQNDSSSDRVPDTGLDLDRRLPRRSAVAALVVPTCLGLLGFFAVAAAVSSTGSSVGVTLPGLLLVLSGLFLAARAPLLLRAAARSPWRRPAVVFTAVAVLLAVVTATARDMVLFTLPAVPTALTGGLVLLSTALWGQFRKGPTPDPILEPVISPRHASFTTTLLVVVSHWLLFLAAAAVSAWFLLG